MLDKLNKYILYAYDKTTTVTKLYLTYDEIQGIF